MEGKEKEAQSDCRNQCISCLTLLFNVTFLNKQYLEKYELNPYLWSTRVSARDHGSMLELVTGAKYMMIEKPEGYSKKEAIIPEERAIGSAVQKVSNKKPHIIAIMNESFSDLSVIGGNNLVTSGEDYLEYYHSMSGNVIKGLTQVPVFGAQTAKSEFEFLTGYSNSFLPEGVMPYQAYVKNGEYNLGAVLEKQGYDTAFMHLFWKNGWNRVNVYNSFGFDETYFLDEVDEIGGIEDSDYIRGVVSDKAGYEKLIDRYEKQKGKDRPLFLFQVTIQNHGGYDKGGIDKVVKVEKPAGDYPKTEEYLACINESDNALEELITYFEKEEEPVIICMFGDHLPTVEQTFRDAMGVGTTEEENSKWYQTPYFIWSNYELNTELDEEVISVNYLSGVLMEAAGLPLDPYHEYLQGMMKKYPVISVYGVKDKDGKWYSWNNALQFEDIREYQKLQYYHLFDS